MIVEPGKHNYIDTCAPGSPGARVTPPQATFSIGIFQWVPKASGKGYKKSKVKVRIVGSFNHPEGAYSKTREIVAALDAGTYTGPKEVVIYPWKTLRIHDFGDHMEVNACMRINAVRESASDSWSVRTADGKEIHITGRENAKSAMMEEVAIIRMTTNRGVGSQSAPWMTEAEIAPHNGRRIARVSQRPAVSPQEQRMKALTLLIAGDNTQTEPCLYCGEGIGKELGGLWRLPGVNPNAAPGMIHNACAVLELARIRTPEFLSSQPQGQV